MKELNEQDFQNATAGGVVLVDFGAEWCAPCKAMLPTMQKVATEYAGKVDIYSVDIDRSPLLAAKNGVMSVPTFVIFKEGRQVERIVGAVSERDLKKRIDDQLPK